MTMMAICKSKPAPGFDVVEVERPSPKADEVLIKVRLASVCGTDFHITNWDDWSANRIKPPLIYGHEFCGIIESVGRDVQTLQPGDYVSAEMHWFCGNCAQCRQGHYHICERGKIYGIDQNGCYAEFFTIPAQQVIKLPPEVPPEYGAFLDSLGNAVHAVSKTEVKGQVVHVCGCGPVGLFAIAVAKALGAKRIYASDISEYRLDLARQAGATQVIKADRETVSSALINLTDAQGVDVVFEMSGAGPALNDAFVSLKQGGTMVLMGIPKGKVELDLNRDIIFKESKVIGVNGRQVFETWHLMLDLLSGKQGEHPLDLDFIITHRLPLSQFGEAMELIRQGKSGKILLEP